MNENKVLKLKNGEEVNLSLTIKGLSNLQSTNNPLYKSVCKVIINGTEDIIEMLKVLYASYLIAYENKNECYSFEEFNSLLPDNISKLYYLTAQLVYPKEEQ